MPLKDGPGLRPAAASAQRRFWTEKNWSLLQASKTLASPHRSTMPLKTDLAFGLRLPSLNRQEMIAPNWSLATPKQKHHATEGRTWPSHYGLSSFLHRQKNLAPNWSLATPKEHASNHEASKTLASLLAFFFHVLLALASCLLLFFAILLVLLLSPLLWRAPPAAVGRGRRITCLYISYIHIYIYMFMCVIYVIQSQYPKCPGLVNINDEL